MPGASQNKADVITSPCRELPCLLDPCGMVGQFIGKTLHDKYAMRGYFAILQKCYIKIALGSLTIADKHSRGWESVIQERRGV